MLFKNGKSGKLPGKMKHPIHYFFIALLSVVFSNIHAQESGSLKITFQDMCWSSDGQTIYFSAMRHKPDYSDYSPDKWSVYKYDFPSKSTTKIMGSAMYVSASPNGKILAIGKREKGNRDIFTVDEATQKSKRITSDATEEFAPAWSPDGTKILFNGKRNGKPEIFTVDPNGSNLQQLTTNHPAGSYNPQWSPDGTQIVFYLEKGDSRDQIYVMDADGFNQKNITTDTLLNYYPSWANNKKIVYAQDWKNGTSKIIICKSNGKKKKQLLNIESFLARFSPDGKRISYVDKKERCIVVVNKKGKLIKKINLPDER